RISMLPVLKNRLVLGMIKVVPTKVDVGKADVREAGDSRTFPCQWPWGPDSYHIASRICHPSLINRLSSGIGMPVSVQAESNGRHGYLSYLATSSNPPPVSNFDSFRLTWSMPSSVIRFSVSEINKNYSLDEIPRMTWCLQPMPFPIAMRG